MHLYPLYHSYSNSLSLSFKWFPNKKFLKRKHREIRGCTFEKSKLSSYSLAGDFLGCRNVEARKFLEERDEYSLLVWVEKSLPTLTCTSLNKCWVRKEDNSGSTSWQSTGERMWAPPWGKGRLWQVQKRKKKRKIPSHFERILNKRMAHQDIRIPGVTKGMMYIRGLCAGVSKEPRKLCFEKSSSLRLQNAAEVKPHWLVLFKCMTTNLRVPLELLQSGNHLSLSLLFFTSSTLLMPNSARPCPDSLLLLCIE